METRLPCPIFREQCQWIDDWLWFAHFMLAECLCMRVSRKGADNLCNCTQYLSHSMKAMMNNFHMWLDAVLSSQNLRKDSRCSFALCDQPKIPSLIKCSDVLMRIIAGRSLSIDLIPFLFLFLPLALFGSFSLAIPFIRMYPHKNTIANALQSIYYTL